jgi:hypothetical protein
MIGSEVDLAPEFQKAKEELKQNYTDAGLLLVDENERDFILQYQDTAFRVTEKDIKEYAIAAPLRQKGQADPVECSVVTTAYREQVVQPLDPIRWRYLPPLEMGFVFGDPDGDEMYASVGAASRHFANFFRFDPTYLDICLERMTYAPKAGQPIDIRQGFYRPPTIRVYHIGEKDIKSALKSSTDILNYCLFELAYLKHLPVGLAQEWPARRRLQDDDFKFAEEFEGAQLPMPPADFNADVVQFYQLAASSRIPVLQFWSYYQVIEHYFVRVSDEDLHRQLSNRLKDPRFKPTSTQLDRLIQDVLDHMDTVDTLQMLTAVLEKFVDETELIAFIKDYEAHLGEPFYTKRRRIFGEDVHVKLSRGSVFENVARTIIAIRHNLMYSPDRTSRTARNISFEQLTEIIRPEIPLMKFLAERVIIGSAS